MMSRRRDERGAVAIMVSLITCFMLFTICALVVDLGFARDQKQASQVASDSAALAGANALYLTGGTTGCTVAPCFAQAVKAVESYTATNFPSVTQAAWSSCADTGKYYVFTGVLPAGTVTSNCISFANDANAPNSTQPTKVRVRMPTVSVPTFFAGITGTSSVPVATSARAKLTPGQSHACGLCLLGSGMNDVGNGGVEVDGADIHTNGGFSVGPNGLVTINPTTNAITTVGGCTPTPGCVPAATSAATITDPYAAVATIPPSTTGLTYKGQNVQPCGASGPGIYTYDFQLSNNQDCVLKPGLYVIDAAWTDGNKSILEGVGVTLYFTCGTKGSGSTHGTIAPCVAPGQVGGSINIKNGDASIVAPTAAQQTATGGLSPFAIIYDRKNTADMSLQGNGGKTCSTCTPGSLYTGTIYAPLATLSFTGNATFYVTNGPIIAGHVASNGNKAQMVLQDAHGATIPAQPSAPNLDQ
jgi:Flp pilus assembly protein TadG